MEQQAAATASEALNTILAQWGAENSEANFEAVVKELFQGTGSLLVPVAPDDREGAPEGSVQLTSIFEVEGMLIFGAFSTEKAIFGWAGQNIEYTVMNTQEVLDFCEAENMTRLVINSNQPDMFVLERETPTTEGATPQEEENQVRIGPLSAPLPETFLDKMKAAFPGIHAVDAAYTYGQMSKGEMSSVLGILLTAPSDEATKALTDAFNAALAGENLELPISMMAIGNDAWLEAIRNIPEALIYEKK